MQGNLHVPFLGGWAGAIPPGYPAGEETYHKATRLVPTQRECGFLRRAYLIFYCGTTLMRNGSLHSRTRSLLSGLKTASSFLTI